MTSTFLSTLAKYTLLIIGFVTALDSMGIKVGAVLASLGIAGLTIGFAARDSLSNIISGILIFLDRPFVIGDIVEIEGFYGRVEKITLRRFDRSFQYSGGNHRNGISCISCKRKGCSRRADTVAGGRICTSHSSECDSAIAYRYASGPNTSVY